ncbi:MAG: hypothetical protein IJV19_05825 [Prevotella sp.]|nr:hypothetical protein [Prevotella sp.]MBQ8457913.1 hypothetical protein [Prevotella sp.]
MAKKRINELNELNMADYIFNESGEVSAKSEEKSSPKKDKEKVSKSPSSQPVKRAEKGAARGCKPGYTRHTYVLPQKMIDQVKAVAHFFSCSEVAAAEQIIQKGLDDIQKKHGKKALTLQKTQNLFE